METTSKPTNKRGVPGRIGVYERPTRTGGSLLVGIFIGLVALIIVAITIYVQFFML